MRYKTKRHAWISSRRKGGIANKMNQKSTSNSDPTQTYQVRLTEDQQGDYMKISASSIEQAAENYVCTYCFVYPPLRETFHVVVNDTHRVTVTVSISSAIDEPIVLGKRQQGGCEQEPLFSVI